MSLNSLEKFFLGECDSGLEFSDNLFRVGLEPCKSQCFLFQLHDLGKRIM